MQHPGSLAQLGPNSHPPAISLSLSAPCHCPRIKCFRAFSGTVFLTSPTHSYSLSRGSVHLQPTGQSIFSQPLVSFWFAKTQRLGEARQQVAALPAEERRGTGLAPLDEEVRELC